MKPVIGITPDIEESKNKGGARYIVNEAYLTTIEDAGGIPLILPYVRGPVEAARLLDLVRGLVVTGGAFDIDPSYYGEAWTVKQGTVKGVRTRFEMEVTLQAMKRDLPLLGICGGEQNINVALKGSLYQDITSQNPKAFDHEQKMEKTCTSHGVQVVPGTLLHKIVGTDTLDVNSTHHQAVKETGEGVMVNALAEDGIIEGIESTGHRFVLGVQWHPEVLSGQDSGHRRIFEALVEACASSK